MAHTSILPQRSTVEMLPETVGKTTIRYMLAVISTP